MIHLYVCLHATTSDLVTYEPCAQLSTCASNAKNYYYWGRVKTAMVAPALCEGHRTAVIAFLGLQESI